jgi:pimeloyl-ACP methyl ester carboxylesterase
VSTEIILQHGWAFDATSWNGWAKALSRIGTVKVGERGYFNGRKSTPTFSADAERKIIIAHSFGAHLLAPEALGECDTLVLFGGFASLEENARKIRVMLRKFAANPEYVVTDFWSNCYTPDCDGISLLPPPALNEAALQDDLTAMLESKMDLEVLAAIPDLVLVSAGSDRIVPEETRLELAAALSNAHNVEIADACHAVHLTQTDKCLQLVTHWISRNQREICQTQKL